MNFLIAQNLIYQARSAACFQVARRHDGVRVEDDALLAQVLQARLNRNPGVDDPDPQGKAPPDVPAPAPESAAAPQLSDGTSDAERLQTSEPQAPAVMPDPAPHFLVVLGETLITKKSKSKDDAKAWDAKTSKQARQTYRLFAKLLSEKGIFKIEQLEQGHFAGLTDFFDGVAKSYGKSQHDEKRSTTELLEIGKSKPEDQRGLSAETINRHVSFLQAWVENARARGTGLDRQIDVSLLRQRTYGRGREKRGFFELDYLDAVFSLPFFTGCRGWQNKDVLETGDIVFHRTLFFAPIMFHYIIARREEICGLLVKDVQDTSVGAVRSAVIWIRWTEQRRVKSPSSKRCIPVHDELIRLGFLEYVDCICSLGYSLVFPDLKSPTSQSPLGDRLYDEFIPGLHKAIPDALALKQVIQSFRRTGGDALKRRNVHSERRSDILGHAGKTITEETYADNLSVEEMRVELAKLPVVTTHLKARPINLLPWVAAKQPAPFSRASRKRERPMK